MKYCTSMRILKSVITLFSLGIIISTCRDNNSGADASGTFEAVETIVPAEANGVIKSLDIREGQLLDSGIQIGYIDSIQLHLKKKQLEAQIKTLGYKLPDITTQTAQFKQQAAVVKNRLDYLLKEKIRIENLLKGEAATPKQLDDINVQIAETEHQLMVVQKQEAAQISALQTQRSGISAEVEPLYIQIEQINDQLEKSKIKNPVGGTVLAKYAEEAEMAAIGKPLYSIADLSMITLRAYITGDQFNFVKPGQKVKVLVDDKAGKLREYEGTIDWISTKAEFTPKTIQTKDERANLVYAVKISVKNDGTLKIGMYGEVKFN